MPYQFLVNAQERHREHPAAFDVPTNDDLTALRLGDCVKLCFNDIERMWVHVTARNADGTYTGTLSNDPVLVDMEFDEPVTFAPQHIYDIDPIDDVRYTGDLTPWEE